MTVSCSNPSKSVMRNFLEMPCIMLTVSSSCVDIADCLIAPLMATTTMVFMLSIAASASAGYFYGSRASLNAVPASLTLEMQTKKDNTDPLADPDEEEDETEENSDGDLATITTGFLEPCKLVHRYLCIINKHAHIMIGSRSSQRPRHEPGKNCCPVCLQLISLFRQLKTDHVAYFIRCRFSDSSLTLVCF